jgi:hypothetical protein
MNLEQLQKHLTSPNDFRLELVVSPSAIALAPSALIRLAACSAHVTTYGCSNRCRRISQASIFSDN